MVSVCFPPVFFAIYFTDDAILVPMPQNSHIGRHVRRIDFSHFRTIGMRRLTGEAIKHRFVTSERLENVLKVRHLFL